MAKEGIMRAMSMSGAIVLASAGALSASVDALPAKPANATLISVTESEITAEVIGKKTGVTTTTEAATLSGTGMETIDKTCDPAVVGTCGEAGTGS
jgi:hypothetical protein